VSQASFLLNPQLARDIGAPSRAPLALHQRLPGYTPTPLVAAPQLAAQLGLAEIWVKDESCRMGLPAFKILGASWASYRALERHARQQQLPIGSWESLAQLAEQLAPLRPLSLVAATDGNHGRAVAWLARQLGFAAHILVPQGTAPARIAALQGEGAQVTLVAGSYDDAVARSARLAGPRALVISDTSWPGYETVPRDVIAGYSTIFWEIDAALEQRRMPAPDLVVVQMGVGALAAAVVDHYRQPGAPQPMIVGVEPTRAACVLASMQAGKLVQVPGPHDSIMAGLNCGLPSQIAWPLVSRGIDLYLAIGDERARQGMRALAEAGITAGETGAAGIGGLLELSEAAYQPVRARLGIGATTRALVIVTEGATDPEAYAAITGRAAEACEQQGRCPLCQA
jgi:diaminopropionate ammonia-lyase